MATYRLKEAVLAIHDQNGTRIPVVVPHGALVTLLQDPLETPNIRVDWNGKTVMMYSVDLRSRGSLIVSVL